MFRKLILSGVSFYNVFIWGIFLQTFYTTWSCFSKTKNVNLWLSPHILVIFGWLENHVILFLHLKQIKIHFINPVFDFMMDFILGAQIPVTKSSVFLIELKLHLAARFHYVFVYLLLNQNHKLSWRQIICILDVARFLDSPQLNA